MGTVEWCAPAFFVGAILAGSLFAARPGDGEQGTTVAKAVGSSQVPGLGPVAPAMCVKWDYVAHPVAVTGTGTPDWPYAPRWAFDGYPTSLAQPYVRNFWRVEPPPTPEKPAQLVIDYKKPVAVTRFVHYFNRFRLPRAFKDVQVLASDDGKTWTARQQFSGLAPDCPQVLAIDKPTAARYYKIVVLSLAAGAPTIETHEIETYYGTSIGAAEQTATASLRVNVVSPDVALKEATLKLVADKGSLAGELVETKLPQIGAGGSAQASFHVKTADDRDVRASIELHAGGFLIDSRPVVIRYDRSAVTAETLKALKPVGDHVAHDTPDVKSVWTTKGDGMLVSIEPKGFAKPVGGMLTASANGKAVKLVQVAPDRFAALVPGGTLFVKVGASAGDAALSCEVVPAKGTTQDFLDLEFRLAVDDAKILFRPHIDWYTVEHGPNFPYLANGHNSTTRMLTVQTKSEATVSMVPDTDNITWGFGEHNEMVLQLQIPLAAQEPPGKDLWKPIEEAPRSFKLVLPVRKGDWWEAYRHVAKDIFHFDEPRQWAMPLTQMQMLNARYVMRYEVWSEKWQTVRSHPWFDFFYNFYGTTYTIPTLYSWYLVTDDQQALVKTQKVVDWLLSVQQTEGPATGGWFSQYCVEGDPPKLVGRDQAWNRWILPHSTATSAKTLLWYWEASGKHDARVFDAAKKGCDWLISIQRPDGGWSYAFDLDGKPITDLADAGQIWCTWVLWKMFEYTGDTKYKAAADRSAQFFKKTFIDIHRYMGYWEDVSGAAGKVNRSWEGYEPAIAALVFADMGEKQLAIDAEKDSATWTWTRVISTRQYETCYGETTEQSLCGPSQAQSPMNGLAAMRTFELTGDPLWRDYSGTMKAINFCADPDQAYGMVATGGWDDPLTGVVGPPYENVRPWVTPNNSLGDEYGRQVWNEWCTSQFAWLSLEWLVREANLRAPEYVKIDPNTYRGTVLGEAGRVKMPEEKCDVNGFGHYDVNWVGYENDEKYMLLVMNHKEKLTVAIRPHEAHLGVFTRPPQLLISAGKGFKEAKVVKNGVQYMVEIPAGGTALLVWERIRR